MDGDGRRERSRSFPAASPKCFRLNGHVKVATGTPAGQRTKEATGTNLIVIEIYGDPVEIGLVASLAHPSINVTGLTTMVPRVR